MASTAIVGKTVSSPTVKQGSVINSGTGQVVGTNAAYKQPVEQGASSGVSNSGSSSAAPSQPSQPSISDQINAIYDPISSYLDTAASGLQSNLNDVLSQAEGDYNANVATAGASNQNAQDQFTNQEQQAGQQNVQTQADTNQLYNELNQGYQQRFGGSSSAGEAASQISAMEQQRQAGQNQRQYNTTLQNITTQATAVQRNYQASLLQLQQAEQAAKNQAQSEYQDALNQINQQRASNQSAKASANLGALQDLRNNLYQISTNAQQYQQALNQQTSTSQQALAQYASQIGSATQAGSGALTSYQSVGAPTSNLQVQPSTSQTGASDGLLAGQITSNPTGSIIGYDSSGNPIYAS